jgi:hypothetical protein
MRYASALSPTQIYSPFTRSALGRHQFGISLKRRHSASNTQDFRLNNVLERAQQDWQMGVAIALSDHLSE